MAEEDTYPDVIHLRLLSGEQIVAQFIGEDPQNIENLVVRYPMLIETHASAASHAFGLSKYLPFDPLQLLVLKKDHVISMTITTELFARYYYNYVEYQETIIQPQNDSSLEYVNKNIEFVLSNSNQQFMETLKKYKDRIPEIPQGVQ